MSETPEGGVKVGETPGRGIKASETPRPGRTGVACHGTVLIEGAGFPEVRGESEDAEMWGLLFVSRLPLSRGEVTKIVWRMTGDGPLSVKATLPDGTTARLDWGPEEHGGSTWHRPGDEWGTGIVFPKRGCWKVELSRTHGKGHLWLPVG